jgi:hypothetical protein
LNRAPTIGVPADEVKTNPFATDRTRARNFLHYLSISMRKRKFGFVNANIPKTNHFAMALIEPYSY